MTAGEINILSIAPYVFLPLKNGGHQAIAKLHHHIGLHGNDHIVSTDNNADSNFSFKLHKIFPNKKYRYLPGYGVKDMLRIAHEIHCTHIICEHPYMAVSAMTVANKLGVPWYIRSHNIESQRFKDLGKPWWPILAKYERYAMQQANGIFFITQEDADWAAEHYDLPKEKCHLVLFGCDLQAVPQGHYEAKKQLAGELKISADVPWLYFLGALDYPPNGQAVRYIVDEIQPRLKKAGVVHEILIAGKGLDASLQQQITGTSNIQTLGFVQDLEVFLNGCDIMLNPVLKGGGIKTKAVEALGYNKTVISSASGAAGLIPALCGDKLLLAGDNDWDSFAEKVIQAINNPAETPSSFYDAYYHGAIAEKVISIMLKDAR
jgi:glycosyltransferase involved in cell wall biosynthesis